MEFPIIDLLDSEQSERWLLEHFHPDRLKCPRCGAGVDQSLPFRVTKKSGLQVYRCRDCQAIYNLYTGTVFVHRHLRPQQAVLLIRGVLKGEPSRVLAAELDLDYITVLQLRRALLENAQHLQSETPLTDFEAESDEMFQNAGEKVMNTSIRLILHAVAPINDVDAAPTRMIVHPCWVSSDGRADS
jgi:transposase-like protein